MRVPYLRDEREQHAEEDNGDVCFAERRGAGVRVHVAVYVEVFCAVGGGCFGHGVHGYVSVSRVSHSN